MVTVTFREFLWIFGLTLFAGLSTAIGGAIAFFHKAGKESGTFLSASLGFSAGVMVYISLVELMSHASEGMRAECGTFAGGICAVAMFTLGLLVTFGIDRLIPEVENPHHVRATGEVDLEDVYFSYEPDQKLIEKLNLSVKPGQRIAIVGPTGCGKTTLINLLMRFYDVNSGTIRVSKKDIQEITRHSLRANYGMVLQETWLRQGTIRENICMGKPDATEEEMIAAAKASHAHSFIKRLKNGYDTVIGEDGGSLSQGQKQLLCITRVMLCLPPMLILDEATSSIDTRTEIHIQHAFSKMMQGRTSFIVAHRLSTIQEADVILVMRDGHIIEQGNHEQLLQQNGFYATLYNSQFAG